MTSIDKRIYIKRFLIKSEKKNNKIINFFWLRIKIAKIVVIKIINIRNIIYIEIIHQIN